MAHSSANSRRGSALAALATAALAGGGAFLLGLAGSDRASAWTGGSFASIPGMVEAQPGASGFDGWLRIEGHYWKSLDTGGILGSGRNKRSAGAPMFSGPPVANGASDVLVIAVDKRSHALPALMAACARNAKLGEMRFAESSERERNQFEFGPRPAQMPAFFEYRLKDVTIAACPVLAKAPEQAIVLEVARIEWANYAGPGEGQPVALAPATLAPIPATGTTRNFVIHWFGVAHDVADDQCPKMNTRPTEADYYALLPKSAADSERGELAGKGGVGYENGLMARRGPGKLNVCFLPGLLPDPGFAEPVSAIARGLDLDGDKGTGKVPANVCKHQSFRSEDGAPGIDNQLFRVQGCMQGYQGHKGFMLQYANEQRRNGALSMIVQVAGIDDPRNDEEVQVALLYSKDPMAKDAAGKLILSDYTFRLSADLDYAHYFIRVRGRIVDGTIVTEQVPMLLLRTGGSPETPLHQAGLRLRILPDGSLKGVVGGYQDWHAIMAFNSNSNAESLQGFQCPGLYNALKRNADGLKDPVTGQCMGISSAYDIEGVPAFIPPGQLNAQVARLKR